MSGYACPQCYQPTLRFINEYQQWWCDRCQIYIPPAAPQPAYQPTYQPAYQSPPPYVPPPAAVAPAPAPAPVPTPAKRDALSEALAKTREGFDKMTDYPRRERELRVKGFTHDEIQLILRNGYTEQQVLDMRGKSRAEAAPGPAPAPQIVVVSQPSAPAAPPPQQTTIIVKGDYVPSKSESRVEIKDSVVNRANISGAEPGGANVQDSVVTRSASVGGTAPASAPAAAANTCPNCKAPSQSGWKACPNCGLRLG